MCHIKNLCIITLYIYFTIELMVRVDLYIVFSYFHFPCFILLVFGLCCVTTTQKYSNHTNTLHWAAGGWCWPACTTAPPHHHWPGDPPKDQWVLWTLTSSVKLPINSISRPSFNTHCFIRWARRAVTALDQMCEAVLSFCFMVVRESSTQCCCYCDQCWI